MKIKMSVEKATKNTIKFAEILENEYDVPKIGIVYIPKSTLGTLGWKPEKKISVEISVD